MNPINIEARKSGTSGGIGFVVFVGVIVPMIFAVIIFGSLSAYAFHTTGIPVATLPQQLVVCSLFLVCLLGCWTLVFAKRLRQSRTAFVSVSIGSEIVFLDRERNRIVAQAPRNQVSVEPFLLKVHNRPHWPGCFGMAFKFPNKLVTIGSHTVSGVWSHSTAIRHHMQYDCDPDDFFELVRSLNIADQPIKKGLADMYNAN